MQVTKQLRAHILQSITLDGYDIPAGTDPVTALRRIFYSEYGWAVPSLGEPKAISEWLSGLPSSCTVAFYNSDILALGEQWGALPPGATEQQQDHWLATWFYRCAMVLHGEFRLVQQRAQAALPREVSRFRASWSVDRHRAVYGPVTVTITEQRGTYYADVNGLVPTPMGVGDTVEAAQLDWLAKNSATLLPEVIMRPSPKVNDCRYWFDCCGCGGHDCGCRYCFDCHACSACRNETGAPCENLPPPADEVPTCDTCHQ
jgi:hypothetical protein